MVSANELIKLIRFSQKTGESLIVGLEDGPVAIVPFDRYQSLATKTVTKTFEEETKQKHVSNIQRNASQKEKPVEKSSSDEEFLVEPIA